jgi:Flp pilus assembly pilin Flp
LNEGAETTVWWEHAGWRGSALVFAAETAQDVVEYGILIGTIAILVLIGTLAFGNQLGPWVERLAGRITTLGT